MPETEDLSWTVTCEHIVALIGRLPEDCTVEKIKEEDIPAIGEIKLKLTPDQVLVCIKMTNLTTLLVKGSAGDVKSDGSCRQMSHSLNTLLLHGSERGIGNKAAEYTLTRLSYWFEYLRASLFEMEDEKSYFNIETWLRLGIDLVFSEGQELVIEMMNCIKNEISTVVEENIQTSIRNMTSAMESEITEQFLSTVDFLLSSKITKAQQVLDYLSRKLVSVKNVIEKVVTVISNLQRFSNPINWASLCVPGESHKKLKQFLKAFDEFLELADYLKDRNSINELVTKELDSFREHVIDTVVGSQVLHSIFNRFRTVHQKIRYLCVQWDYDVVLQEMAKDGKDISLKVVIGRKEYSLKSIVETLLKFEMDMSDIEESFATTSESSDMIKTIQDSLLKLSLTVSDEEISYVAFINKLADISVKWIETLANTLGFDKEKEVKDNISIFWDFLSILKSTLSSMTSALDHADHICKDMKDVGDQVQRTCMTIRNSLASKSSWELLVPNTFAKPNCKLFIEALKTWLAHQDNIVTIVSDLSTLVHNDAKELILSYLTYISTSDRVTSTMTEDISIESIALGSLEMEFSNMKEGFRRFEDHIIAEVKGTFQSLSNDLKLTASTWLQKIGENFAQLESIGDGFLEKIEELGCGEFLSSLFSIANHLVKTKSAKQQQYKVREVAAFCIMRLSATPLCKSVAAIISHTIADQKIFGCAAVRGVLNTDTSSLKQINDLLNISSLDFVQPVGTDNGVDSNAQNDITTKLLLRMEAFRLASEKDKAVFTEKQSQIYDEIKSRISYLDITRESAEKEFDALKKQEMLYNCREEQRALRDAAMNLEDLSKKLDIVIYFLSDIQGQLDNLDKKLDNIQKDIEVIRDEMKRMAGRPALEVVKDWSQRQLEQFESGLQSKVYVECAVCGPGLGNDFKDSSQDNPPAPVLQAFEKFLEQEKNILLISGGAGSGKSTAIGVLKRYILEEYSRSRAKSNKVVVLLPVSLPTLRDPLGGVFEEGARLAYDLSPTQIQELKDSIKRKNSTIELVLLLDAYDELRPDALGKNLWQCNNLEQYRDQSSSSCSFPKVIMTCRSEYLSEKTSMNGRLERKYVESFLPFDLTNEKSKDQASQCFEELRIISFGNKREAFQRQHVAIQWRNQLMKMFNVTGVPLFCRPSDIDKWLEDAKVAAEHRSLLGDFLRISTVKKGVTRSTQEMPPVASNVLSGKYILKEIEERGPMKNNIDLVIWMGTITALLYKHELATIILDCLKILEEEMLWLPSHYEESFQRTKELSDLTTTPFMVEVVTEILPSLKQQARPLSDIKSQLILSLGTSLAEEVWAVINKEIATWGLPEIESLIEKYMEESRGAMPLSSAPGNLPDKFDLKSVSESIVDRFPILTPSVFSVPADAPEHMWKWSASDLERNSLLALSLLLWNDDGKVLTSRYGESIARQVLRLRKVLSADSECTVDFIDISRQNVLDASEETINDIACQVLPLMLEKDENKYKCITTIYGVTIGKLILEEKSSMHLASLDCANESGPHIIENERVKTAARQISSEFLSDISIPPDAPDRVKLLNRAGLLNYLIHVLSDALTRPRVRRSTIYASFVDKWVSREVSKARTGRSPVSPQIIKFECSNFCSELAIFLTQHGKSKLERHAGSQIFLKKNEVDVFFSDTEVAYAVRRAGPVQETGGFLGFIHKTIQEYYVAEAIVKSISETVEGSLVTMEYLNELEKNSTNSTFITKPYQLAMNHIAKKLCSSPLNVISLDIELAVVDFIVDFIMGSSQTVASFEFAIKFIKIILFNPNVFAESAVKQTLSAILQSILQIMTLRLPRRGNQMLLHVACTEGSMNVVMFVIDVLKGRAAVLKEDANEDLTLKCVLDEADNEKRTALFLAADGGHAEISKLLLENGADSSLSGRAPATLELIAVSGWGAPELEHDRTSCSIKVAKRRSKIPYSIKFVVGCPAAIAYDTDKCYMYEVEVKAGTAGHPMFIGWTSSSKKIYLKIFSVDKFYERLYLNELRKINHVGMDADSIGMHMYSYKCLRGGHLQEGSLLSNNSIPFERGGYVCNYEESELERVSCNNKLELRGEWCQILQLDQKRDLVVEQDSKKSSFFGTALDFTNKRIYFAVNGEWRMLDADTCEHLFKSTLFPALSSAHGAVEMDVNLGQKEFKYPLPLSALKTNLNSVNIFPVNLACAGVSPLLKSAKNCDFDCYKLFELRVRKNMIQADFATGKTLLHYLIINCIRSSIEEWLSAVDRCIRQYGPKMLNNQDFDGRTPLMLACERGVADCVKGLLDAKADVELIDKVK